MALNRKSIPCQIYEGRREDADVLTSGVVITPNGCRVLDELGVLDRIESKSYRSEYNVTKNEKDKTVEKIRVASKELTGYPYHRLYRLALLQELKSMLNERNIPIVYNSKFEKIVSETADGVIFQVSGQERKAAALVGCDGIHSSVRHYLTDAIPEYTGILCVYGHIPTSSVQWPDEDFKTGCTIQGKPGGLFMVPEVADVSELMVGMQFPYPEQDREGWDSLNANKELLCSLIRKDYDQWHDTAREILDQLSQHSESLLSWPFYAMPRLISWASSTGRVVMIGDAAHAMPPSSGQGVNQAFEDALSLAMVLSSTRMNANLPVALRFWQSWRQGKIEKVLQMAKATNSKRMPEAERLKLLQNQVDGSSGRGRAPQDPSAWLFDLDLPTLDAKLMELVN